MRRVLRVGFTGVNWVSFILTTFGLSPSPGAIVTMKVPFTGVRVNSLSISKVPTPIRVFKSYPSISSNLMLPMVLACCRVRLVLKE